MPFNVAYGMDSSRDNASLPDRRKGAVAMKYSIETKKDRLIIVSLIIF